MSDSRLRSIAERSGMSSRELARCIELELVDLPTGEIGEPTLCRLRSIHRLRRDLGIDLELVAIIVRLLDRIRELEDTQPQAPHFTARVVDGENTGAVEMRLRTGEVLILKGADSSGR